MPRKTKSSLKKVKKVAKQAPKKTLIKKKSPTKRKPTKVVSKQDLKMHTLVSKVSKAPTLLEENMVLQTDLPQIRVQFVDAELTIWEKIVKALKNVWSKIATVAKNFFAGGDIQL